jgi:hypothetical protein
MSYTDTGRRSGDVRTRPDRPVHDFRETKPSFMTTEFWAMIAGLVAIIVIYNAAADASFNLWRAMVVGTAVGVGYLVSRGLAKAGSHDDKWETRSDDWPDGRRDDR